MLTLAQLWASSPIHISEYNAIAVSGDRGEVGANGGGDNLRNRPGHWAIQRPRPDRDRVGDDGLGRMRAAKEL
jgi:hypothetical protein